MFLVTAVLRRFPFRTVKLTAMNDVRGTHRELRMLRHSSEIQEYPYHFDAGSMQTVSFAPWRRLVSGDQLSDSDVLNNPSMQRIIERNCARPASQKWTITRGS